MTDETRTECFTYPCCDGTYEGAEAADQQAQTAETIEQKPETD